MAALRFEAMADNGKWITRLGHHSLFANLHTWRTFVRTEIDREGVVTVTIGRDGAVLQRIEIEAE